MTRPIPRLRGPHHWQEVPIEPADEPLVGVAEIGGRVWEDPRLHTARVADAPPACWVRQGVAERIARAAEALPDGLGLLVWDAHRSLRTQAALYDGYLTELLVVHPDWPADALEEAAARYLDPPTRSLHFPPLHVTGGAVDLTLADADGRALDLGASYDPVVPETAAADLDRDEGPSRALRRTLHWAMADQGFTGHAHEWWHFDHGDQLWGLIRGLPARYGAAERPE